MCEFKRARLPLRLVCVSLNVPVCPSGWSSEGASSVCSGSLDASIYTSARSRKSLSLMTMPMTLAFCHLALLWVREALTLADLLR